MMVLKSLLATFLLVSSSFAGEEPVSEASRRTCLWFGWDTQNLSAESVLKHAEEFDKSVYDGVPICVQVKNPETGKMMPVHEVLDNPEVTDEMLASQLPILKEIASHRGLKASFVSSFYTPKKRVAWTDDATWGKAARSLAALGRLAKAAGLRGLFMDQEEYHPPKQFEWQPGDPDFETCAKLARQRGAECFRGVFAAMPEAHILSCFGMLAADANFDYFGSENPMDATRQKRDLWPHFYNGILDVAPITAKLVDGTEMAYEYLQTREEYAKSAAMIKQRGRFLVAPENRIKYAAVTSASYGFFIDAYVKTNRTDRYFYEPLHGSKLGRFADNLAGAAFWSDEYIWLYSASQRMTGIHWNPKGGPFCGWTTPEDRLPGYDLVVRALKDPIAFYTDRTRELKAKGALVNLMTKPIGEIVKSDEKNPKLAFGIIEIPEAKAGEIFGFGFRAKGEVQSIVRWGEEGLRARPMGASIAPSVTAMGKPDADGWREAIGVVRIPNERTSAVVVIKIFRDVDETSAIGDFVIYRLFSPRNK